MLPHGGREAEVSKGRAKATAVIRCIILKKWKGVDGQFDRSWTVGRDASRCESLI